MPPPLTTSGSIIEKRLLTVLRPNVTLDQAVALLTPKHRSWDWLPMAPPLRSIAEFYVPFQLFRVVIGHRSTIDERFTALDLFSGLLDPFEFPAVPPHQAFLTIDSCNHPGPQLTLRQAVEVLRTKLQRLIFQVGFFRATNLKLDIEPVATFHMPYWLSFYGTGQTTSVQVLDATRRVKEGAKFRRLVSDWLIQQTNSASRITTGAATNVTGHNWEPRMRSLM